MNKKMFVVSRDKKEALELSSQNKNVGYIKENNITFYPDDISIVMKESETLLNDLDTFNKLGYKAKINTHTTSYIN